MPGADAFEILAEIAVGIAGFSSVVVVIARNPEEWAAGDAFRTRLLLLLSFATLLLALLPVGLATSPLAPDVVWRISSAAILATSLAGIAYVLPARRRELDRRLWFRPVTRTVIGLGTVANLLAQLLNALGVGFGPGPTAPFFGLVWQLAFAAFIFARIVFVRPA